MRAHLTWTEQGTMTTGECAGGDAALGECFSRRFTRPGAVVDVHHYAGQLDQAQEDTGGPYAAWRATEYTVCTDPARPGDTELWSDQVEPARAASAPHATLAEAEAAARHLTAAFHPDSIGWDGQPFFNYQHAPNPK